MLLLYSIAVGLLLGRIVGGRARNLEQVRFHWLALALGGFAVQLVLFADIVDRHVDPSVGIPVYIVSTAVVFAALLRNLAQPGFPLIAVGAALNLTVIVLNGGLMPTSPDAWLAATGMVEIPAANFSNSAMAGPGTLLPFLGDNYVFPRPLPMANVFSIGDVLIAGGAIVFLVVAMRRPRSEPTTADRTPSVPRPPAGVVAQH